MEAIGEFVYKGIAKKDGGKFTNDKGQEIEYKPKYVLKVDEVVNGDINERKLNIAEDNISLVDKLKHLSVYDKIRLKCDVVLYQNMAKVVPVSLVER